MRLGSHSRSKLRDCTSSGVSGLGSFAQPLLRFVHTVSLGFHIPCHLREPPPVHSEPETDFDMPDMSDAPASSFEDDRIALSPPLRLFYDFHQSLPVTDKLFSVLSLLLPSLNRAGWLLADHDPFPQLKTALQRVSVTRFDLVKNVAPLDFRRAEPSLCSTLTSTGLTLGAAGNRTPSNLFVIALRRKLRLPLEPCPTTCLCGVTIDWFLL